MEEFYKEVKYKGKIKPIRKFKSKYKIKKYKSFKILNITCAGMPKECYGEVTFDNFKVGFSCGKKLQPKHIKGGVKLFETEFTIKEEKIRNFVKS